MNHDQNNGNNEQTADNAAAAAAGAEAAGTNEASNTNTKKKSKLRRFGGYALKGVIATAVVGGIYFGARALMGSAGDAIGDAVAAA